MLNFKFFLELFQVKEKVTSFDLKFQNVQNDSCIFKPLISNDRKSDKFWLKVSKYPKWLMYS